MPNAIELLQGIQSQQPILSAPPLPPVQVPPPVVVAGPKESKLHRTMGDAGVMAQAQTIYGAEKANPIGAASEKMESKGTGSAMAPGRWGGDK